MGNEGRHIPNKLKKYRRLCGYTQLQVARKLGMKKSTLVSEWEKGKSAPHLKHLVKLCALYHTLIEELYFDLLVDAWHEFKTHVERITGDEKKD